MRRFLVGFLLLGLLELALIVKAGEVLGTWFPLLAVVMSMVGGVLVIRHHGLMTLRRLDEAVRTGVLPAGRASAGLAGVFAGILLILPGFLSDFFAILLLIPSARRIVASMVGWQVSARASGLHRSRTAHSGPTIEAEAVEIHSDVRAEPPVERISPWQRP